MHANHTFVEGHIDFDVHDLFAWVGIYFLYFWWTSVKNYLGWSIVDNKLTHYLFFFL
jgi:hypothetical protein